jgi:hypothetical protein
MMANNRITQNRKSDRSDRHITDNGIIKKNNVRNISIQIDKILIEELGELDTNILINVIENNLTLLLSKRFDLLNELAQSYNNTAYNIRKKRSAQNYRLNTVLSKNDDAASSVTSSYKTKNEVNFGYQISKAIITELEKRVAG